MTEQKKEAGPAPASEELDVLFKQWEKEEARVSLADLRLSDSIVFLIFWALFFVVFLQFVARYVFNDSPGWTEEIARYLLIGVTFVGSVMAMRKGTHIAVEVAFKYLKPASRHWLLVAVDATVAAFCALMAWTSADLSLRTNQYMVTIEVSKAIVYWVVCASFVAMTGYALWRLVRRLQGREADAVHSLNID